ncbi:MAG: extensin family protein [Pseudomonadota bacterium]
MRTLAIIACVLVLPSSAALAQDIPLAPPTAAPVMTLASAAPLPPRRPGARRDQLAIRQGVAAMPRRRQPRIRTRRTVAAQQTAGAGCAVALATLGVSAQALPPIRQGRCGAERPFKVTRVANVELSTPATLRCGVAEALAGWVRTSLQPSAKRYLGARVTRLRVAASYHCRMRRTGRPGGSRRLSEHGRANAIDISAFTLEGGRTVSVGAARRKPRGEARFLNAVREGACGPFKTVLGPGSDPAHHNHFHFDRAERRRGGTYCR